MPAVPPEADGSRLDGYVAATLGVSRAVAARLIDQGEVKVGGQPRARSFTVRTGQRVDLPAPPAPPRLEAEPGDLMVVYEDDEIVVVDKPAGLVVHPGAGVTTGTLAGRLLERFPELAGVGEPDRPGIVHRLDRDTSGLLLVARTLEALEYWQAALRRRDVRRDYLALVAGTPALPRGTIDAPIRSDPQQRGRRAVGAGGRPARTHYVVRERFTSPASTLLEVNLETGRTHQIRVHLAAIDLPVAGDAVYGGRRAAGAIAGLSRPFLHAFRLGLPGRPPFESPLPPDLASVLDRLRRDTS